MKNFLVPYRDPFRSMKYPVRETWKWVCVDFYFLCHEYLQCNIACFYVLIHNFSTRFWTNSLCYEHEVSRISNKLFCKLFMNIPIFSRFLFTGFSYLANHHLKHSICMFWVLVNLSIWLFSFFYETKIRTSFTSRDYWNNKLVLYFVLLN